MPAKLIVSRNSPDDVQNRQIYVKLNGERLATLLFGKQTERDIPAGNHELLADNTWKSKKLAFTIADGETVHFSVVSRPGLAYNLLVGFFGAAPVNVEIVRARPDADADSAAAD